MPNRSRDPLHGVTLEKMLVRLHAHFGWQELGKRISIRCFQSDPSIQSSLKFLRKTPWARAKVEALYVEMVKSPWYRAVQASDS
ncbi:MAG: transporter [Gammaproteobacteria bacterium]|nr:MAG: transporter [Gammaproteobacteria bacterium]